MLLDQQGGTRGRTADDVRKVEEMVGPREAIEGLIVEGWGVEGDRLLHITVWEPNDHKDRYEAEQLFPALRALGMAHDIASGSRLAPSSAPT